MLTEKGQNPGGLPNKKGRGHLLEILKTYRRFQDPGTQTDSLLVVVIFCY